MIEVTDMTTEYSDIEDLVIELGEGVLRELRDAALAADMPEISARLAKMEPAMAEATLAHVLWYLVQREVVDPTRILKLLEICTLGAAATFAEGGCYSEQPQA